MGYILIYFFLPILLILFAFSLAWLCVLPLGAAYQTGIRWAEDASHRSTPASPWYFFNFAVERRIRRWKWIWSLSSILVGMIIAGVNSAPYPPSGTLILYEEYFLYLIEYVAVVAPIASWTWVTLKFAGLGLLSCVPKHHSQMALMLNGWVHGVLFFGYFLFYYGVVGLVVLFILLPVPGNWASGAMIYFSFGFPLPMILAAWNVKRSRLKIEEDGERYFRFSGN